ncbi:hypothetical protein AVEN_147559-1 [Araneus ventricosus]|uniref:Uncharacterized protein n=1 Tax=Araneus ventricosus TaxID=182803 RepID=A0A4Y2RWT0_ARAVE|nr:hypothetical protein AVEN_147559-1 [Araneus ventricosus]
MFPGISEAKIKEGVFAGPDIRKLCKDEVFESKMEMSEKKCLESFQGSRQKFVGNLKDSNFKCIVENMLTKFKDLDCSMNLKMHFLNSHVDYFPENLAASSERTEKKISPRYQGDGA